MTARARSQTIISFRRSRRSASTPPTGDARKKANSCAKIASPTYRALCGGFVDQAVDRHPQEPVAAERDHRGEEQRNGSRGCGAAAKAGSNPPGRGLVFVGFGFWAFPSLGTQTIWGPSREEVAVLERIPYLWVPTVRAPRWIDDERTIYIDPWGTALRPANLTAST